MSDFGPIQIVLGEGKVSIDVFNDPDGRGIILRDTGETHEIGSYGPDQTGEQHLPQSGEIYIKCTNVESAKVLLERVERIIEGFEKVVQ